MEIPELVLYGDGYYRNTVYSIRPYIADYPEQALLSCIVQGWCARYSDSFHSHSNTDFINRCSANHNDLDGNGGPRSHELTEALYDAFDAKALWDE